MKVKKSNTSSIVMYTAAAIVFLIGVASLINNILYNNKIIAEYSAQGYPQASIFNELLLSSILPAIFQTVGLYFGTAAVLFGIAVILKRISAILPMLKDSEELAEETTLEEENTELNEVTNTAEEVKSDNDETDK